MNKSGAGLKIICMCIAVILHAEGGSAVTQKIDSLVKNGIVEIGGRELDYFCGNAIKSQLIAQLKTIHTDSKKSDALIDYIETGNYKIVNALKLKDTLYFLNYEIRTDENKRPRKEKSEKALGHAILRHHIFLTYNTAEKRILHMQYTFANYIPIYMHKYEYGAQCVLYGIGNNSSFGMATTDVYFIVFSPDNLELLFSERILFSQEFYSKEVEDIGFEKDFIFNGNSIRFIGRSFDFDKMQYVDYDKTYTLP